MDYNNRPYLMAESNSYVRRSTFHENEIIFKKGDNGNYMYEVENGCVGIFLHYGEPNETLLDKRYPGDFFGEIALTEKRPRTATAVALVDNTNLNEITSNEGFISYIRTHPDKLEGILDAMSNRFKEQRRRYFEVCEVLESYYNAVKSGSTVSAKLTKKVKQYAEESEKHRLRAKQDEK